MPSYPLKREEFEQKRAAGQFNTRATYEDYLAMIQERAELKRETEEAMRRDGYELGAPELELTAEDDAILDRAWAALAAQKAAEQQSLTAERAA
jgi:hypothetical protein